jgi:hypothetical protein
VEGSGDEEPEAPRGRYIERRIEEERPGCCSVAAMDRGLGGHD